MGEPDVVAFLVLLIVIAAVAATVRVVRIPYTVALVLTGLVLALLPQVTLPQLTPRLILTVFLPVLLFYGAYNLDMDTLRANALATTLMAVPGVLITASLVGAVLHLTTGLPWLDALIFGSIVAATDAVAVHRGDDRLRIGVVLQKSMIDHPRHFRPG